MDLASPPRRRRPFWQVLVGVVLALGILVAAAIFVLSRSVPSPSELMLVAVDLSRVADGQYEGEFGGTVVGASVLVTVSNQRIVDVALLRHRSGRGKPAEVIVDRVVAEQTLAVDTVAGATISSKVILKAIEAALIKGVK